MRAEPGAPPQDRRALAALVADNYPIIAPELLRPVIDLHSTSREACGGDTDKFLIMLVVGLRTTEDKRFSTYSRAQLLSGELPVFPTLGINVRSIADSIGVPRETVRRKVRQLIDAGWIDRKGNELRYTSLAYQRLSTTRAAIEQLAIRNYVTVSELMRRRLSGEAPASQAP